MNFTLLQIIVALALAGTITAFSPSPSRNSVETSLNARARVVGIGGLGIRSYEMETKFFGTPRIGNRDIGGGTPARATKVKSSKAAPAPKKAAGKANPFASLFNKK